MGKKKIMVRGGDGKVVEVDEDAAMRYTRLIEGRMEADGFMFPIPEFSSDVLGKVFEYCEKIPHVDPTRIKEFRKAYAKEVENSAIIHLARAASHLPVKGLLALLSREVAGRVRVVLYHHSREILRLARMEVDYIPVEEDLRQKLSLGV